MAVYGWIGRMERWWEKLPTSNFLQRSEKDFLSRFPSCERFRFAHSLMCPEQACGPTPIFLLAACRELLKKIEEVKMKLEDLATAKAAARQLAENHAEHLANLEAKLAEGVASVNVFCENFWTSAIPLDGLVELQRKKQAELVEKADHLEQVYSELQATMESALQGVRKEETNV